MKSKEILRGAAVALALSGSAQAGEALRNEPVPILPKIQFKQDTFLKSIKKDGYYTVTRLGDATDAPVIVIGEVGGSHCPIKIKGTCGKQVRALFGIKIEKKF